MSRPQTRAMRSAAEKEPPKRTEGISSVYIWPTCLSYLKSLPIGIRYYVNEKIDERIKSRSHSKFVQASIVGVGVTTQQLKTFPPTTYNHIMVDMVLPVDDKDDLDKVQIRAAVEQFCTWFNCTFINCPRMNFLASRYGVAGKKASKGAVEEILDVYDEIIDEAIAVTGGIRVSIPIALDRDDVRHLGPDVDAAAFQAEVEAKMKCHLCLKCRMWRGC